MVEGLPGNRDAGGMAKKSVLVILDTTRQRHVDYCRKLRLFALGSTAEHSRQGIPPEIIDTSLKSLARDFYNIYWVPDGELRALVIFMLGVNQYQKMRIHPFITR